MNKAITDTIALFTDNPGLWATGKTVPTNAIWGKTCQCIGTAIETVTLITSEREAAFSLVIRAIGKDPDNYKGNMISPIMDWNDSHTFDECLALLHRANTLE